MVRRLAREALRKIDGELPFERQKQLASQQDPPRPGSDRSEARKAARARPEVAEPGALNRSVLDCGIPEPLAASLSFAPRPKGSPALASLAVSTGKTRRIIRGAFARKLAVAPMMYSASEPAGIDFECFTDVLDRKMVRFPSRGTAHHSASEIACGEVPALIQPPIRKATARRH